MLTNRLLCACADTSPPQTPASQHTLQNQIRPCGKAALACGGISLCLHSTSGCSFQIWHLPLSLHCPSALQLACSLSHKLGQDVSMVRQVSSASLHAVLHSGQEIITTLAFSPIGGGVRRSATSYPRVPLQPQPRHFWLRSFWTLRGSPSS